MFQATERFGLSLSFLFFEGGTLQDVERKGSAAGSCSRRRSQPLLRRGTNVSVRKTTYSDRCLKSLKISRVHDRPYQPRKLVF